MEHLTRQLDLIPTSVLGEKITIIGAGAIGSFTALTLAKMGFVDISVWDFDEVSIENMNSQFYRRQDIGKPKVEALYGLICDFTETEIDCRKERYQGGMPLPGIVISAVDSMQARRLIWDTHKNRAPHTKRVIDPRMGAEVALMYVMDPNSKVDQATYEKTLYTDQEGLQERCTAKAVMYTATMLSGLVAKAVKDILVKEPYTRTAQWSIKDCQLLAWNSLGVKTS